MLTGALRHRENISKLQKMCSCIDLQTYAGSDMDSTHSRNVITLRPSPLTFWPQGQCMLMVYYGLYLYRVWYRQLKQFSF